MTLESMVGADDFTMDLSKNPNFPVDDVLHGIPAGFLGKIEKLAQTSLSYGVAEDGGAVPVNNRVLLCHVFTATDGADYRARTTAVREMQANAADAVVVKCPGVYISVAESGSNAGRGLWLFSATSLAWAYEFVHRLSVRVTPDSFASPAQLSKFVNDTAADMSARPFWPAGDSGWVGE